MKILFLSLLLISIQASAGNSFHIVWSTLTQVTNESKQDFSIRVTVCGVGSYHQTLRLLDPAWGIMDYDRHYCPTIGKFKSYSVTKIGKIDRIINLTDKDLRSVAAQYATHGYTPASYMIVLETVERHYLGDQVIDTEEFDAPTPNALASVTPFSFNADRFDELDKKSPPTCKLRYSVHITGKIEHD